MEKTILVLAVLTTFNIPAFAGLVDAQHVRVSEQVHSNKDKLCPLDRSPFFRQNTQLHLADAFPGNGKGALGNLIIDFSQAPEMFYIPNDEESHKFPFINNVTCRFSRRGDLSDKSLKLKLQDPAEFSLIRKDDSTVEFIPVKKGYPVSITCAKSAVRYKKFTMNDAVVTFLYFNDNSLLSYRCDAPKVEVAGELQPTVPRLERRGIN